MLDGVLTAKDWFCSTILPSAVLSRLPMSLGMKNRLLLDRLHSLALYFLVVVSNLCSRWNHKFPLMDDRRRRSLTASDFIVPVRFTRVDCIRSYDRSIYRFHAQSSTVCVHPLLPCYNLLPAHFVALPHLPLRPLSRPRLQSRRTPQRIRHGLGIRRFACVADEPAARARMWDDWHDRIFTLLGTLE
jgi:hypothetical protein